MGQVKVEMTWDVLQSFFQESKGIAFAVTKGLPESAQMVSLKHVGGRRHVATFESEELDDVKPGMSIPKVSVEYMAYEVSKPKIVVSNP